MPHTAHQRFIIKACHRKTAHQNVTTAYTSSMEYSHGEMREHCCILT